MKILLTTLILLNMSIDNYLSDLKNGYINQRQFSILIEGQKSIEKIKLIK